jgi:hypothetical protein
MEGGMVMIPGMAYVELEQARYLHRMCRFPTTPQIVKLAITIEGF